MQLLNSHLGGYPRLRVALTVLGACMTSNFAVAAPDISVRYIPVDPQSAGNHLSISADARYAAYQISSLGHMFVHDLVENTLVRATLLPDGTAAPNPQCSGPVISGEGRYVVFGCNGFQMGTSQVTSRQYYYVYDRINNKTDVIPMSISEGIDQGIFAGITANGRYVAYRTVSSTRMFVRDMVNKTTLETTAQFMGLGQRTTDTNISDDGRYISYSGFGPAGKTIQSVSVYNVATGVTEVVNVDPAGVPSAVQVTNVSMSADGNVLAFQSTDNKLTSPTAELGRRIFVRDRRAGKTEFINPSITIIAPYVTVSPNGRYVSYVGVHNSNISELYVYDRYTKVTRVVPGAFQAQLSATAPQFSADGRYLVFHSANISTKAHFIGIADLGEAAGVTLSSKTLALTEGGAAGTYTLALNQAPTANVVATIKPDAQLSVARTQLTFTPDNWSVPQVVSVQALQDGVVEGLHSGTVTNTVTSTDVNFTVIPALTVTVAISDATVPTLLLPGATWNQTDLPLTGTAAPGATVMLTATNRNTGWLTSVSAVADAQGRWSYTLTGLSDGVIEFDVQADGVHGVLQTITVALPPKFTDVTGSISAFAASMAYNRATGKYVGDFVLTNIGTAALAGPLQLEFDNLSAGIALANASGSRGGAPYITVPAGLAPGAAVTIPLVFDNPARGAINYDTHIFSGSF